MTMEENKKGRKSDIIEYEQRIVEGMEMILVRNLSYTEFKKEGSQKWNISERAAETVYKDIRERLRERYKAEGEDIIAAQIERYFNILQRAREDDDRITEINVLKDLTKLYGLDTKKVDITTGGQPISINILLDKGDIL